MSSLVVIMSGLAQLHPYWGPVGSLHGVVSDWPPPLHSARLVLGPMADLGLSAFVVGMNWSLFAGGW